MADIEVGHYDVFDQGVSTTNKLKTVFETSLSKFKGGLDKISDSSIFMGPIADNCLEAFTKLNSSMDSAISDFSSLSQNLTDSKNTYIEADKQAGLIVVGDDGKITVNENPTSSNFITSNGYVSPFSNDVDYYVVSDYGKRHINVPGASTNHRGIDIHAAGGTEIHSISDGEVIWAGPASGFGQMVKVRQKDGTVVVYGHTDSHYRVKVGDQVKAGDVLTTVGHGKVGTSSGPHLHLEIRTKDSANKSEREWIDPQSDQVFGSSLPQKT